MDKIFNLKIDTKNKNITTVTGFKQFDNNSVLNITLLQNSLPLDLSNCTVRINFLREDERILLYMANIDNAKEGKISIKLSTQVLEKIGTIQADISVFDSNLFKITSATFNMKVEKSIYNNDYFLKRADFDIVQRIHIEEEQRIANEKERVSSENTRNSKENTREQHEILRIENENRRNNAEQEREIKEKQRITDENLRIEEEVKRKQNEDIRIEEENKRNENEAKRVEAEAIRVKSENTREEHENIRIQSEKERNENEDTRIQNEQKRQEDEATRINTEQIRIQNEEARTKAETIRIEAEKLRIKGEDTRIQNEEARVQAEQEREANESKRVEDENKREEVMKNFTTAEEKRVSNEEERIKNDTVRNESIKTMQDIVEKNKEIVEKVNNSEETRIQAETLRINAEDKRVEAEKIRESNENKRVSSEEERIRIFNDMKSTFNKNVQGDMKKIEYDKNGDGIIDEAEHCKIADESKSIEYSNIKNAPNIGEKLSAIEDTLRKEINAKPSEIKWEDIKDKPDLTKNEDKNLEKQLEILTDNQVAIITQMQLLHDSAVDDVGYHIDIFKDNSNLVSSEHVSFGKDGATLTGDSSLDSKDIVLPFCTNKITTHITMTSKEVHTVNSIESNAIIIDNPNKNFTFKVVE